MGTIHYLNELSTFDNFRYLNLSLRDLFDTLQLRLTFRNNCVTYWGHTHHGGMSIPVHIHYT